MSLTRLYRRPEMNTEELFAAVRYRDHEEMYLKAIWRLEEWKEAPARVASISRLLRVKPPSVVGMLRKLDGRGLVRYTSRQGIRLTSKGRRSAERLIRNCRLVEVFMKNALNMPVDEKVACDIEHRLTEEFTDGLCRILRHPRICPHGHPIPTGKCCLSYTPPEHNHPHRPFKTG